MSKKILLSALVGIAAISAGTALASAPMSTAGSDVYVGGQIGYGDTHWDNWDNHVSDTGLAGGVLAGYDINQYLAVEAGYVYFPRAKEDGSKINTYGIDAVGKITVPVANGFGLYAKAGLGYLHSSESFASVTDGDETLVGFDQNVGNYDFVYGVGANYQITSNWVADVSFTRFNGDQRLVKDDHFNFDYQPNADFYALGLTYKFNV